MDTETFSKQASVAILAIAQHTVEHQLTVPMSIDVDSRDQSIRIRVAGGHEQWLNTLCIDDEVNEPGSVATFLRTAWSVRLPESGVRFELVTYRQRPILTAVSA